MILSDLLFEHIQLVASVPDVNSSVPLFIMIIILHDLVLCTDLANFQNIYLYEIIWDINILLGHMVA
jgi:hypothetical protein